MIGRTKIRYKQGNENTISKAIKNKEINVLRKRKK
jgi:hypothetical protein